MNKHACVIFVQSILCAYIFPLFSLSSSAIIGPPSVTLFSNGNTIEVSIEDPEFTISTLRSVYSLATYNMTYWKDGQEEKVLFISYSSGSFVAYWEELNIINH